MSHGGEYEQSAVRCHQCAPEGCGKRTCYCRTDEGAGNNVSGVCCCEGNGSFGNETATHNNVGYGGISLCLCKLLREEDTGKGNAQRRHHAAYHNGCHGNVACLYGGVCQACACCQQFACGTEYHGSVYISRLVDGTAHVNRHHTA